MGYYYGIYLALILITYFILRGRVNIFRETAGKIAFWSAALIGLVTPYIFRVSTMVQASFVYIGLAIVVVVILTRYKDTEAREETFKKPKSTSQMMADKPKPVQAEEEQPVQVEDEKSVQIEDAKPVQAEDAKPEQTEVVKPVVVDTILIKEQATVVQAHKAVQAKTKVAAIAVTEVFAAIDELLLEKSLRRYGNAIKTAKKLLQSTSLPNHMRQMVTYELADLYLETPDYKQALEQLYSVYKIGSPSKEILRETDHRIEEIKAVKGLLEKNNRTEIPWSSVPRLIKRQAEKQLANHGK